MTHRCIGLCILHADVHPLTADCWEAVGRWLIAYESRPLDGLSPSDAYALAVERDMLDAHIRAHRPTAPLAFA